MVQIWPHGEPLPEGAQHREDVEILDHHRFWTTIIEYASIPIERG
jgi:hypothetical protein